MIDWLTGASPSTSCQCAVATEGQTLSVDATDCAGNGDLAERPDCRETVIGALGTRDVDRVVTRTDGRERAYLDEAAALLVAAGRFAARVAPIDERLAGRARRDPLRAATEAVGRTGPVADLAAETGLSLAADGIDDTERAFDAYEGPSVSDARVAIAPPEDATLRDRRTVETDAVVRLYETPDGSLDCYHVEPREQSFDAATRSILDRAYERLATAECEPPSAHEATAAVTENGTMVPAVGDVLAKHTTGLGVLEDLFADTRVSDVFASAPVTETHLRVRVDGETMRTNVRLTESGARALASTFRRTSGRAFARADPTLDATATVADRQIRVAGVTEPVSDGLAFAFRAHDREHWRLADLVENGTMPAAVAGLLSVAVERGAACLVAGPRGAGKTTTLGALLWELPQSVRALLIEDTPELPAAALRADGRDVQALQTASGNGPSVDATEALRTALRLGDGALVVGEIRGDEAGVLYEAMRVGSGDSAVLGTIHGDSCEGVRERLVSDLSVSASSFAATDLLLTLGTPAGASGRRVESVVEVIGRTDGVGFEPLFERDDAATAGRIERGTSRLVERLARPEESYADVRAEIRARADRLGGSNTRSGETPVQAGHVGGGDR